MRNKFVALLGLLMVAQVGEAQPPAASQPTFDPARDPLDQHLLKWQQVMQGVNTMALECKRVEVSKVYQTRETLNGSIHFKKPTFVYWNMAKEDNKKEWERIICTGTYIYQFLPAASEIKVYPAPQLRDGRVAEDNSLAFLFGMKAEEAKRRYDLKLHKEDQHYVYVDVVPRFDVDKVDFQKARLVLNKKTYLPRQLWFQHPNGGEVMWDIPNIQTGHPIPDSTFQTPAVPEGWKMVHAQPPRQSNLPPRVVRPKP